MKKISLLNRKQKMKSHASAYEDQEENSMGDAGRAKWYEALKGKMGFHHSYAKIIMVANLKDFLKRIDFFKG